MLSMTQMSRSATQAQSLPGERTGTECWSSALRAVLSQHWQLLTGFQGEQNPAVIRSTAEEFCHCIYKSVQNTENVLDSLAISHTIRVKGQRLTRNGCQRQSRNGCGLSQTKSGAAILRTITMEINCTCLTAPCLPRLLQLGGGVTKGIGAAFFLNQLRQGKLHSEL